MKYEWKFNKTSYTPGEQYCNIDIWIENDGATPIHLVEFGIIFDWQRDKWYCKSCNYIIHPDSKSYVGKVNFEIPENVIGEHTCRMGVVSDDNQIRWSDIFTIEIAYPLRFTAFFACSLWPSDETVEKIFKKLCWWIGIDPLTIGREIACDYEETVNCIEKIMPKVDCLIGVLSPRHKVNGYLLPEWNVWETAVARTKRKPIYIFYEESVNIAKPIEMAADKKYIFNRDQLTEQLGLRRIWGNLIEMKYDLESRKSPMPIRDAVVEFMREHPLITLSIGLGIGVGAAALGSYLAAKYKSSDASSVK